MSRSLARLRLVNSSCMEGSAKIISLIARDENQHLVITQNILNKWREGDDPEMQQIA
jgi:ribonucleoside-diphosphate reductase beta chain